MSTSQELIPPVYESAPPTVNPDMVGSATNAHIDTRHLSIIKAMYREIGDKKTSPNNIPHIGFHVTEEAESSPDTKIDVLVFSGSLINKVALQLDRDLILDVPGYVPPEVVGDEPLPPTPPAIYQVFGGQFSDLCDGLNNGVTGPEDSVILVYLKPGTTLGQVVQNIQAQRIAQTQSPQGISHVQETVVPLTIQDYLTSLQSSKDQILNTKFADFPSFLEKETTNLSQTLENAYGTTSTDDDVVNLFKHAVDLIYALRNQTPYLGGANKQKAIASVSQIEKSFQSLVVQITTGFNLDDKADLLNFHPIIDYCKNNLTFLPIDTIEHFLQILENHQTSISTSIPSTSRSFLVSLDNFIKQNPHDKKLQEKSERVKQLRLGAYRIRFQ